jgi:NNP family nitrate/nitrite transporter-like MFS transporter
MHFAIRQMEQKAARHRRGARAAGTARKCRKCTTPEHVGKRLRRKLLTDWRPEDPAFWEQTGQRRSRAQSLDLDPRPAARLRGLDGVVGGRRQAAQRSASTSPPTSCSGWRRCPACRARRCASSTASWCRSSAGGCGRRSRRWSLMIPAIGIGYAVQNPDTPYWIFLVLALLCGFGGGNFASSMSNISFFFPKAEKGNALALNAGLGNLGVSGDAVRRAAGHHRGRVRCARRRRRIGQGRRRQALAAERRLHLGAVHHRLGRSRPGSA